MRALRRSAEGHGEILTALRGGDPVRVAASVRSHILDSAANQPDTEEEARR